MIRNLLKYSVSMDSNSLKGVISVMFRPEKQTHQQIIPVKLPITDLIPDFFTSDIDYYELQPTTKTTSAENTPSNSFVRFNIPLKTNVHSRLPFGRLGEGRVRIGRILQLMDSLAGFSMTKFANSSGLDSQKLSFTIATASIDNIFIDDNITCQEDIVMQSNVNFVGSTSAEIEVNLIQHQQLKASGLFTMVSRQLGNIGKGGKGYVLPALTFKGEAELEKCVLRNKRGEESRKLRLERAKKSLQVNIPTAEQITILHQFFLERGNEFKQHRIPMSSSITYRSLLMHSQYRNMNNKIFGGFLMRQMVETAYIAGRKYASHSNILFERIEDIFFIEPVQIGEGVDIKSQVVYTDDIYLVIKVEADKIVFHQDAKKIRACQLYITFEDMNKRKVTKLYPTTYEEGIEYLMGRRVIARSKRGQEAN